MKNNKKQGKPAVAAVPKGAPAGTAAIPKGGRATSLGGVLLLLTVILGLFFWKSFVPGMVVFSNDSPLGVVAEECVSLPTNITGAWSDLNWLGMEGLGFSPSVTGFLRLFTSPVFYAKFYCPIALFLLGLGAWYCFRKMKLAPMACVIGALAAALNSDFFSTACWGVESQMVAVGADYLALGFLLGTTRRWVGVVLAGFAVGMNVMEAYDIGALFSLFVAAFAIYQSLFLEGEGSLGQRLGRGVARTAVMAVCAGLISLYTLSTLVGTQIQGIAGAQQNEETKQHEWAQKTQWSLPKAEILQLAIPGIFGYRMDWQLYDGGQPGPEKYWGTVGGQPGLPRFSGTGIYAGVFVSLIVLWTVVQSLRNKGSPFSRNHRRIIWFFVATAVVSVLLAFGKYAPFYQFFYALPYASTIRNPFKFIHAFSWALTIVFAVGLHGLFMGYLLNPVTRAEGAWAQFKAWRARAVPFDRAWLNACIAGVGVTLLGWLVYASMDSDLQAYLRTVGIGEEAPAVAHYSILAVGWFLLLLAASVVLLGLMFSGQFAGPRARWAGVLMGGFVLFDLGRADLPWIVYWDAPYKYYLDANYQPKNSPIINDLTEKRYEHRVTMLPPMPDAMGDEASQQQLVMLFNAYGLDWKQALFMFNNVQSFDVVQEARVAIEKDLFLGALPSPSVLQDSRAIYYDARLFTLVTRHWELSNTRYLLGLADQVDVMNERFDPVQKRFRVIKRFDFVPRKPNPLPMPVDFVPEIRTNGHLALIELTSALPRAKLFSRWMVDTNENSVLQTLSGDAFDPRKFVIVSDDIAAADRTNGTKDPGAVEIKPNYRSKRIELEADVKTPSVLLLCDRYSPKWTVTVDGKPEKILRCNFIERGVLLQPGKHTVVFQYATPLTTLYLSCAMLCAGSLLWVGMAFVKPKDSGK